MKIYSTRHGQTDYNKNDLILGTTDMEINETGLAQAAELAEKSKRLAELDALLNMGQKDMVVDTVPDEEQSGSITKNRER